MQTGEGEEDGLDVVVEAGSGSQAYKSGVVWTSDGPVAFCSPWASWYVFPDGFKGPET